MSGHELRPPEPAEDDLAWCHEAVQGVSRTFALTVDVLDEPMSSYICLGYLLCRVADTVEDAGHVPSSEQARLLRLYDEALDPDSPTTAAEFEREVAPHLPPAEDRGDDWAVVANADRIVGTFERLDDDVRAATVPPVREMVTGMAEFVDRYADRGGLRLSDRSELEEYCYYAAGTVGTLITNLLTREGVAADRAETLEDTAEEFGLLLQLVNISKDVYDDYTEEDNVYLPREWLAEVGVDQESVLEPANRDAVSSVVVRTADHARTFLDDAQRYLQAMPLRDGNTIAAWAIPYLLAVGTLRELDDHPAAALTEAGVKVSRQEVFAVVSRMTAAGVDAVPGLRETIASRPLHTSGPNAD
ncbi:MAG: phytoene/squalene synthase family protein [Halolamina sp.]